jgi:hypothetical protein
MANRIPFTYGEFYDLPRMLRFQFEGEWYFLRSEFDEKEDEYTDFYDVYRLPFRSEEEIRANPHYWMNLGDEAHLGRIAIAEVGLDETRRQSIDGCAFKQWLLAGKQQRRERPVTRVSKS